MRPSSAKCRSAVGVDADELYAMLDRCPGARSAADAVEVLQCLVVQPYGLGGQVLA